MRIGPLEHFDGTFNVHALRLIDTGRGVVRKSRARGTKRNRQ